MQVIFYEKGQAAPFTPTYPVSSVSALDESLDTASLTIENTKRKEPFTPFTIVEVNGEFWMVAGDETVRTRPRN